MKTCKKGLHQYEPTKGGYQGCLECKRERQRADRARDRATKRVKTCKRGHVHTSSGSCPVCAHEWYIVNGAKYKERHTLRAKERYPKIKDDIDFRKQKVVSSMRYYERNKELINAKKRDSTQTIVRSLARSFGFETADIPSELVEAKRAHIKLLRLIKETQK